MFITFLYAEKQRGDVDYQHIRFISLLQEISTIVVCIFQPLLALVTQH